MAMTLGVRREKARLRAAAWRAAHPGAQRDYLKRYHAAHRNEQLTKRRAHYAAHRNELTSQKRAAYVPHPRPEPKTRAEKLDQKRAYRQAHLAEIRAMNKAYRAANQEKVLACTKAWKRSNRGKWYAGAKRWALKNPAALRAFSASRRARVARVFVESVDPYVVFARDEGTCGICRHRVDPTGPWEIDHVMPISKGGAHSYANVQLAHRTCNRSKSATVPKGQSTSFQIVA